MLVVAAVQSAALGAEAAARHAARLFIQQPSSLRRRLLPTRAVRFALDDYGIEGSSRVTITCVPSTCLEPGALVTVQVSVEVPLPLVPSVLPGDFPLAIALKASAVQRVSMFGAG